MNLMIDLSPTEAAQLATAAQESGLTPEALLKKLLHTYLPSIPVPEADPLDALLSQWQTQEGTSLLPDVPVATLFAQWDQEDAQMTAEERAEEARLWEDLELTLSGSTRKLQMRRVSG